MKTESAIISGHRFQSNECVSFRDYDFIALKKRLVLGASIEQKCGEINISPAQTSVDIFLQKCGLFSILLSDQAGSSCFEVNDFSLFAGKNELGISDYSLLPGIYYLTVAGSDCIRLLKAKILLA